MNTLDAPPVTSAAPTPRKSRAGRRRRGLDAARIVRQLAAESSAPREALETLERALERGPVSDPAAYLARILRYRTDGVQQVTVLPQRATATARSEEAASAPHLFDGHHVGGYRAEPRNGPRRAKLEKG